jgi:hypothetical protein
MRRGTLALWADNLGYYHKELRPYRDELSLVARLMPAMVGLLAASTSALVSRRRRGSLLSHAFKVNVLVTGTFSLFAGRATSAWMPCLMVGVLLALIFHVADSPRTGDL